MSPTRREFIKTSGSMIFGASAIGTLGPEVLGQAPTSQPASISKSNSAASKSAMVVVYLRGGADPLQVIIPYRDPLYYGLRPTVGIPIEETRGEDGERIPGLLPLNNQFGLNPNMKPLVPLFKQGMIAPIINVGSTHPTRSHFDAQDFMERAAPGIKSITEGWLNRFLQATKTNDDSPLRAVALQPTLPRSLRGQYPVLASPEIGDDAMRAFTDMYGASDDHKHESGNEKSPTGAREAILSAGQNTIAKISELQRITSRARPGEGGYPRSRFGRQMQQIAALLKSDAGVQLAAVDYGGWDDHYYMGAAGGVMGRRLGDVSESLAAFATDMGEHMNNTLVLLMSEFGRTVAENGNNGTDHGHGGFMLAMGGAVQGKRIHGRWTGLERSSLYQGRDMPVHTDFRDVFAEALGETFRFDCRKHNFFPGYNLRGRGPGVFKAQRG